jgi:hypothetical protein
MKKIKISICFALVTFFAYAQVEINNHWKNQVNPIFQGLNKSYVPHGILLDYAMEFTNVPAYNGTLTDSTFINANVLGNIYKTLFMGRVTTSTQHFTKIEDFASNWMNQRQSYNQTDKSTIVLSGLYYKYAQINPTALSANKITVSNNKYYDKFVNGVWQNPYMTKQTIAFALPLETYNKLNFGVILPQNLLLSNSSSSIQNIKVNFNDGGGYKNLSYNQKVFTNYTQNGTYDWIFKTTLTNGEILYTRTKVIIDAPLPSTQNQVQSSQNAYANNVHISGPNGSFPFWSNGAILRIDYAPSHNGQLRKPLIVAEGFDTGSILSPERDGGDRTLNHFLNDIRFTSGNQLRTLLDFDNTQEYDIVYIDWKNGTNSIQHNSAVLRNVINWVNQKKQQANSNEQNVLLGQSMGGLIGRYTLAKMEQENLNHNVRLFIAHDSPMQGANTPLSFQYFSRHANDQYTSAPILYGLIEVVIPTVLNLVELMSFGSLNIAFPSVTDILTIQDTPAAVQMNYHYVDYFSNPTMAIHEAWQQEFDNVGYPTQCRNVAISNGNECAVNHGFAPRDKFLSIHDIHNPGLWGDLLHMLVTPLIGALSNDIGLIILGVLPGSSKYFFDFDLHSNPEINAINRQVYWGKIRYEKKLLWLLPISHTITNRTKYAPNGYLPFDTFSGGFYDFVNNISFDFQNYIPSGSVINSRYGFIPVVSALDIKRNNGNVNPADYLKTYAGGNTPEPALTSGFDNFIVDFIQNSPINNAHISFQPRNGNWLARELQEEPNLIDDCSFICSSQITGPNEFCTNGVYSVPQGATFYDWQIIQGSNLVSMTGNGSRQINLTRSNSNSGLVTIRITYGDNFVRCGNTTLEKEVWVGTLNFNNMSEINPNHYPHMSPIPYDPINECQTIGLEVRFMPLTQNVLEYQWEKVTQDVAWHRDYEPNDSSNRVLIFPTCNKDFVFKVRARNACGWSQWFELTYSMFSCNNPCPPPFNGIVGNNFILTPNPVTNGILNVSIKPNAPWFPILDVTPDPDEIGIDPIGGGSNRPIRVNITIANQVGAIVLNFPNTLMPASLNLSNLPTGSYYVHFEYIGQIESHIILKH